MSIDPEDSVVDGERQPEREREEFLEAIRRKGGILGRIVVPVTPMADVALAVPRIAQMRAPAVLALRAPQRVSAGATTATCTKFGGTRYFDPKPRTVDPTGPGGDRGERLRVCRLQPHQLR